jgi:hypothetical protein
VPLAPEVTVSQAVLLLTAVHAHVLPAVTATLPVPPAAPSDWLVGVIEYEQGAASVTVNVVPAIVIVPLWALVPVLAAALKATVPLPVPLAPEVTVSQDVLLLTAVHAHAAPAVTATLPVPPAAPSD